MAVGLLARCLGRFAREEDHASAGRHLRVAAGAGRQGGEHGAVPVAAARRRPFPVDGEIPAAPHLLHLGLHLNHENQIVRQRPSGRPCGWLRRMFALISMTVIIIH